MHPFFALITVIVVLVGGAAGAVAVEDDPEAGNVSGDVADAVADELAASDVEEQIDSSVTLTGWTATSDGGIRLTFDAEQPTRVTVTSQDELSEGVGRMAIERQRVLPGGTTITVGDTEAVAITTEETVQNGYGVTVSTTDQGGSSLPTTSIAHGVVVGIVTMTLGMAIAVNRKRAVDHMKVESGWKD